MVEFATQTFFGQTGGILTGNDPVDGLVDRFQTVQEQPACDQTARQGQQNQYHPADQRIAVDTAAQVVQMLDVTPDRQQSAIFGMGAEHQHIGRLVGPAGGCGGRRSVPAPAGPCHAGWHRAA